MPKTTFRNIFLMMIVWFVFSETHAQTKIDVNAASGRTYLFRRDVPDGDARAGTVTLSEYNGTFSTQQSHTFSDATQRTITIDGQNITHLSCSDGMQLTAIDVSKSAALIYLNCRYSQLASLNVTKNTALTGLICLNNQLTSLDVINNTALTSLACQNNKLDAEALNALFGTLHSNPGSKTIRIGGNPGTDTCDRSIATKKGWSVQN